jgi:chitin synthase
MPSEQLDIDSGYDEALRNLRDRLEVEPPKVSEAQMQEDYYRAVRTYMVSIWVVANAVLAMAVSESYSKEAVGNNGYLAFVLWSVAGLAAFRALGSSAFAVLNIVHKIAEGQLKFAAAGGSGGSSGGSSAGAGSTWSGSSDRLSDWISEKSWGARRKMQKVLFWRR